MAKSKSTQVQHLRGIINQLKKEIKRTEKRAHNYEDLEEKEADALLREEMEERKLLIKETCPLCGSKELDIIDGKKMKVFICQSCNYRASKKV